MRLALTMALLLAAGAPRLALADDAAREAEIRNHASASFATTFDLNCPVELAWKAVDHPLLMAELWRSLDLTPAYRVTRADGTDRFRVIDPSGIEGELRVASHEGRHRTYLAVGRLEHWALPALNSGSLVVDLRLAANAGGSRGHIRVLLKADSVVAGTVLGALNSQVETCIRRRVTANLRDAARVLERLARSPETISGNLDTGTRQEFLKIFAKQPGQ